jgi:carbon monoxide dehydrogenase subunit G
MFTINAEFRDKVEVKAPIEKVREFLFDLKSFAKMIPEIEGVNTDAKGVTHWSIAVEIPVVGKLRQTFLIEPEIVTDEEITWRPAAGEKQNLLRYSVMLREKTPGVTLVQVSQKVELRRNKPRELHTLASLAGEQLISREMSKRVALLIKYFLRKAKQHLEI